MTARHSYRPIQRRRQAGFVLTTELVLLVTVLVIGTVIGWVAIRDAAVTEMYEFAESIKTPNSGYAFSGLPSSADVGSENSAVGQSFTFDYLAPNNEGGLDLLPGGAPVDPDNRIGTGSTGDTGTEVPPGYVVVIVDGAEVLVPVTDPVTDGGTGTDPVTGGGTGTDPVTDGGTATDPVTDGGTGTDPVTGGGTGTDPVTDGGTGTDPVTDGGTGTDPVTGGGTGTDPVTGGGTGTDPVTGGGTGTDPVTGGGTGTDPVTGCKGLGNCDKNRTTTDTVIGVAVEPAP